MPGDTCCVCKSRRKKKSDVLGENKEYIAFYRIPKCKRRRKQWFEILNLTEKDFKSDPTEKQLKICSRHFSPDSINFTYPVPRLRDDALPNLGRRKEEMVPKERVEISMNEASDGEVESSPEKTEDPVLDSEEEEFTKTSVNEAPKNEFKLFVKRLQQELQHSSNINEDEILANQYRRTAQNEEEQTQTASVENTQHVSEPETSETENRNEPTDDIFSDHEDLIIKYIKEKKKVVLWKTLCQIYKERAVLAEKQLQELLNSNSI